MKLLEGALGRPLNHDAGKRGDNCSPARD